MRVNKEFWIDGESLEIIKKDLYENIVISKRKSTSKLNKITISYEIDREVTIKESDIDRLVDGVAFSIEDISIIKKKLFGGGENE